MLAHDATEFFRPWEVEVDSYESLTKFVSETYDRWLAGTRVFAWRGVANATWSFHSSLYRRLWWANPDSVPDEPRLYSREGRVLRTAHRWGLHRSDGGRLSILEQLAMMQHFGAPTRPIDVSFNPLIAAWFAVQDAPDSNDADGRLFAVDVTTRLISEDDDLRDWENVLNRPWKPGNAGTIAKSNWRTSVWAWKPPGFFGRISRSVGQYLLS